MGIDAEKWPELKKVWDAYGHDTPFEKLEAIKSQRGCYAVVCWKNEAGRLELADLARARDTEWEMQNDCFGDSITEAEWRKLRIVEDCDWFVVPGNENFKGL